MAPLLFCGCVRRKQGSGWCCESRAGLLRKAIKRMAKKSATKSDTKTKTKAPVKTPAKTKSAPKAQVDFFTQKFGVEVKTKKTHDTHGPGMPFQFHAGMSHYDSHRQGDLYITLRDPKDRPDDYVKVELSEPNDAGQVLQYQPKYLQLVPGGGQGSRHCLDSLMDVQMWLPPDYGPDSLRGPWLSITEPRVVTHPTHGHSKLIPGIGDFNCTYQRTLDAVQRMERRAAD